jgi:hypothetical protein
MDESAHCEEIVQVEKARQAGPWGIDIDHRVFVFVIGVDLSTIQ